MQLFHSTKMFFLIALLCILSINHSVSSSDGKESIVGNTPLSDETSGSGTEDQFTFDSTTDTTVVTLSTEDYNILN